MRYHLAVGGGKTRTIGLTGISCETCDRETKQERGCHLPGYSFRAELPWKIDHSGHQRGEDLCWACPVSVAALNPDVKLIVSEALSIKQRGLSEYTGMAIGDLDAWYVGAFELVENAAGRAQAEAEQLSKSLSEEASRVAAAQRRGQGFAA